MRARLLKIVIPVVLFALAAVGLMGALSESAAAVLSRAGVLQAAAQSYEDGLYRQSILQYKQAFEMGPSVDIYRSIHEVYETYYEEEGDGGVFTDYLDDMTLAYELFPEEVEFWEAAFDLNVELGDDKAIYKLAQAAIKAGVNSERINETYAAMSRQTEPVGGEYEKVMVAYNGMCKAYVPGEEEEDGTWVITDESGNAILGYEVMGFPNAEGMYICKGSYDVRLMDMEGVPRRRYRSLKISDAGMIDPETGLVPVKGSDGKWRYLESGTGTLREDAYDDAGTFAAGMAAVRTGDSWFVIDTEGNVLGEGFEDIKLLGNGTCLQAGALLFAKRDGRYAIYDAGFNPVSDFTCEDIDIYVDGPVAFKQDDQWGFVNLDGSIVLEPTYKGAKSFALGNAAVCPRGSFDWGFVDANYEWVVDNEYYECEHFANGGSALVQLSAGVYSFINYKY